MKSYFSGENSETIRSLPIEKLCERFSRISTKMKRTRVKIKYVGKPDPSYIAPSGAPIGYLAHHGKIGKIVGNSPKYNSSFLVVFPKLSLCARVQTARPPDECFDIHDQHFEYLPCICSSLALHQSGCQCGGI